jgi:hypothetical protein
MKLDIEKLEARIAPGGVPTDGGDCGEKQKGNNGYGNGGDDPAPGGSGKTGGGKPEDVVR